MKLESLVLSKDSQVNVVYVRWPQATEVAPYERVSVPCNYAIHFFKQVSDSKRSHPTSAPPEGCGEREKSLSYELLDASVIVTCEKTLSSFLGQ